MDEQPSASEPHDPYGAASAPEHASPEKSSRRTWMIAGAIGVVVLAVGGFFGVEAVAGGGSSSTSTASQGPGGGPGGPGRRGTIGTLQSIDGSTLTVATFARGGGNGNGSNGGGGAGAVGSTTTVTTGSSTKFFKTVSGALSDIKVGDRVTAMGTPDGNNTVSAARITDTGTMTGAGFGGLGAGNGGGRRFGNGNNPNGGPPSSVPNGGTRPDPNSFANGIVKSISGTTLTVADAQGATKTVNTTGSTAYAILKAVSINDLQTGQLVVIGGKTNSDGTISATSVVQGVGGPGGFGRGGRFRGDGPDTRPGNGSETPSTNGTTTQ